MISTNNLSLFKAAAWEASLETKLDTARANAEVWKNSWDHIDNKVLDASYKAAEAVKSLFQENGILISIRERPKDLKRMKEKQTEELTGRHNYHRPISDLAAARVVCEVSEILNTLNKLKEIVEKQGGIFSIRDASEEQPYGEVFKNRSFTEITQFAYFIFSPKEENVYGGIPFEIQIGHALSGYTFHLNSEIRNRISSEQLGKVEAEQLKKENPTPFTLKISKPEGYSRDISLYRAIADILMAQANGTSRPNIDVNSEAERLYAPFGGVPKEMKEIIASLVDNFIT